MRWASAEILGDVTRAKLEEAPGYDPSRLVDRAYEQRLHDYYGQRPYWLAGVAR